MLECGRRKAGHVKSKSSKFGISSRAVFLTCIGIVIVFLAGILAFYYHRFSGMIDELLSGKMIRTESRIFASPKRISVGQILSSEQLVSYLQSAGYSSLKNAGAIGQIRVTASAIEIRPSADSYFSGKNALQVEFSRQRITQLRSLDSGDRLISAEIEPELISELFGEDREKRRPVRYQELPRPLLNAILSEEDKRFFDHPGFDPIRILGAALADFRSGEKAQGASTITMQVARSFFFSNKREWRRKIKETCMALILEHRFSKETDFRALCQ